MRLPAKDPRERLRDAIRAAGVSQAEFARKLRTTPAYLNNILAGTRNPGVKVGARIEDEAGIPTRDWAEEEKP